MLYRRLGRTELQVSELSLGAARVTEEDRERFTRTLHTALDKGINFIDTAAGYGISEDVLGEVLTDHPEIIIETKYCPYASYAVGAQYTGSPDELRASVEQSLTRLRRDHIDILLGHGIRTVPTLDRFMEDGCYEAMTQLRDEGKVRFIGISELSEGDGNHEVLQRAVPSGAFDVVMLTLNFLLQTAEKSVLPLCTENDVGAVGMMPLNQASPTSGLVSVAAARECVRRHIERGNLPDETPYTSPDLFAFLLPYSIPEAALRYVLAHPEMSTVCVGTRRPQRLLANLRAVDPPYLDEQRMARLRQLFGSIRWQVR